MSTPQANTFLALRQVLKFLGPAAGGTRGGIPGSQISCRYRAGEGVRIFWFPSFQGHVPLEGEEGRRGGGREGGEEEGEEGGKEGKRRGRGGEEEGEEERRRGRRRGGGGGGGRGGEEEGEEERRKRI